MRIKELSEGKWLSDFNRYRQMGQNPTQLATHLAKKTVGAVTNEPTSQTVNTKSKLGDTTEIKTIIDNVIAGKPLDSRSLQALKEFRRKL